MSRSITLQPCFVWRTFLDHDINQTAFQNWSFSPSWAWTTHLKASLKPPASKLWEKQESHPQILPSMQILLFHIVGETHALGNFSTCFFCWFPLPQPLYLGPCSTSNLRFKLFNPIHVQYPPKILWMDKILVTTEHGKTKFKPLVTVKHW